MDEISPWASRRKTFILAGVVLALSAVSFLIFWHVWYEAPNCFDGLKNGDETGVDCGGSCTRVCGGEIIKPIIRWDPRLFQISPGVWSVLVYVENPNINIDAVYVPYSFTIHDTDNRILEEKRGATILPKNQTVGIFEGPISIADEYNPKRVFFTLGENITWKRNEKEKEKITISHTPLLREDTAPRVEAMVRNEEIEEIKNIELVIAIFDGSDNAVASSRTFVESLQSNASENILFTWPKPFDLGTKACEKPSDIMLLLDRSGSMASVSQNPPQPFSAVKEAAISFIEQLGGKDQIGVVSFAGAANAPIDFTLSADFDSAKEVVGSIAIGRDGVQYTNIYDALRAAREELLSARAGEKSSKIIVLLTDGVANNPRDPSGRTEADDIKYAENAATHEAANAKQDGIGIYTIGLGNGVNSSFLKAMASGTENYFFAPSAADLEKIYQEISSDICKEVPARIEITYRIFGSSI